VGLQAGSAQSSCSSNGPFFGLDGASRCASRSSRLARRPSLVLAHDAVATWVTLGLGFDL